MDERNFSDENKRRGNAGRENLVGNSTNKTEKHQSKSTNRETHQQQHPNTHKKGRQFTRTEREKKTNGETLGED